MLPFFTFLLLVLPGIFGFEVKNCARLNSPGRSRAAAVYSNKGDVGINAVIILGGLSKSERTPEPLGDIIRYNVANKTTERILVADEDFAQGIYDGAAVLHDETGDIYYFGGLTAESTYSDKIYTLTFVPETGRFLPLLPTAHTLPVGRAGASAQWIAPFIYIFGGHVDGRETRTVLRFNPNATETENPFVEFADALPFSFGQTSTVAEGTNVYVFERSTLGARFDTITNTSVALTNPLISQGGAAVKAGGIIHILGRNRDLIDRRQTRLNSATGAVEESCSDLVLPKDAVGSTVFAEASNEILIIGGEDAAGHLLNSVICIDVNQVVTEQCPLSVPASSTSLTFSVKTIIGLMTILLGSFIRN